MAEIEREDLKKLFIISSDDWRNITSTFQLLDVVNALNAAITAVVYASRACWHLHGLTDPKSVMIDCDNMPFRVVKKLALIVMEMCRLGGFIILRSSKNHYHVVFDRYVSLEDNLSAVGWFSVLSHNPKVKDYLVMQCIKKAPTLRVVPMNEKPAPRLVYRFDCQDHAIKDFLRYRQLIKRIYRSVS